MPSPSPEERLAAMLENGKGLQFRIKTGKNEYICTLQDRAV